MNSCDEHENQKLIAALDEFVNQVRWRYCLDPRRSKEKEKKNVCRFGLCVGCNGSVRFGFK